MEMTTKMEDLFLECAVELQGDAYDYVKEVMYVVNVSDKSRVDFEELIKCGAYIQKMYEEDVKSITPFAELMALYYIEFDHKLAKAILGNMSSAMVPSNMRHAVTQLVFDYHMKDQTSQRELELYDLVTTFGLGKGF